MLWIGVGAVGFVTLVFAEEGPAGSETASAFLGTSVTAGGFAVFGAGREVGPEMALLGEACTAAGVLVTGLD